MKRLLFLSALSVLLVGSAQATSHNLLNNGDFGLPDIGITNFVSHVVAPEGFEWTIMSESSNFAVSQIGTFWAATGGPLNSRGIDQSVQISRTSSLSQSFATSPGAQYELSFFYSHNPSSATPSGGAGAQQDVTVVGNSVLFAATFLHTEPNSTFNMMWTQGLATFVADSSLTTLTFAGPQSTAFNFFALDNVAVSLVPEPGTAILIGLGLVVMGIGRRRLV